MYPLLGRFNTPQPNVFVCSCSSRYHIPQTHDCLQTQGNVNSGVFAHVACSPYVSPGSCPSKRRVHRVTRLQLEKTSQQGKFECSCRRGSAACLRVYARWSTIFLGFPLAATGHTTVGAIRFVLFALIALLAPPRARQETPASTMRIVCFSAASVALCAAFVPRAIPFISLRTISAGRQREQTLQVRQNQTQSDAIRASGATSVDGATQGAGAGTGKSMATVGVIVCDHGSRRENANEMLFEVAERYRSFAGIDIVEVGGRWALSFTSVYHRCFAAFVSCIS